MSVERIEQRLKELETQAKSILALFTERRITPDKVPQAQARMHCLKADLESEYKRMSTGKGDKGLSKIERAFYYPAVQDAWTNTGISSVRWDSRPDGRWYDAIWSVADYMRYWQHSLSRQSK